MNAKVLLLIVLTLLLAGVVYGATVPVDVTSVEVENYQLDENGTNRLNLEKGNTIGIDVTFLALDNASNIDVEAFLSGYEYSDKVSVSDSAHISDVEAGTIYRKNLEIALPENIDEDDYRLRVLVSNRNDNSVIKSYRLKITPQDHKLSVEDVLVNPSKVSAGMATLTTVRVKNQGDDDENDVKVEVSIPELGVSASDYIDEIKKDDSKSSEELYLRIPNCVSEGLYEVVTKVTYDEGYETEVQRDTIYVTKGDSCSAAAVADATSPRIVLTAGPASQVVSNDEVARYPITITNTGDEPRVFTVQVAGAESWAKATVTPSSVVVVAPGETAIGYVDLTVNDDVKAGTNVFSVLVSSDGKVVKQFSLAGVVEANADNTDSKGSNNSESPSLRVTLEIGLIVLIVLLILVGIIIGFSKAGKGNDEDDDEQTYY